MAENKTSVTHETYWDKYDIPRVPLSEAQWNLEQMIKHNQKRGVLCFISEAGEGKSQVVHAVARKHNRRVCDVRTAQLTHIGAGVPQRADGDGHFKVAVPDDFPREGEQCIMFFDEMNQGQSHAIALVFKMLEDRGIYGYTLPDDTIVVVAMNPSGGAYAVSKIENNPALNRRMKKFYVYTDYPTWRKHATTTAFHYTDGLEKPCHPMVIGYLDAAPKNLYMTEPRDIGKQFACPATWQTVSLDLYLAQADAPKEGMAALTSEKLKNRIAASINNTTAEQLMSYIKQNGVLITPEDILSKYSLKTKRDGVEEPHVLRTRVLEMQTSAGGDYPQLLENVAQYLLTAKPDVKKCAPHLLLLWEDMPAELAQGFFAHLKRYVDATGAAKGQMYIRELTTVLQKDYSDRWNKLNDSLEATRQQLSAAVKK